MDGEIKKFSLRQYLKRMSDDQIIATVGMAEMLKIIWLLETKHNSKVQAIPLENDVLLRASDTNVANMSYLAVYLHFLTLQKNILLLEGNISIPSSIKLSKFFIVA